ncbi:unnamed protein product [Umbelopsis sp. WA50703]
MHRCITDNFKGGRTKARMWYKFSESRFITAKYNDPDRLRISGHGITEIYETLKFATELGGHPPDEDILLESIEHLLKKEDDSGKKLIFDTDFTERINKAKYDDTPSCEQPLENRTLPTMGNFPIPTTVGS